MRIVIAGIGPDAPGQLTLEAAEALRTADTVLLRTRRHGVAAWLSDQSIAFSSLDTLYENADDFDAFNRQAADEVLRASAGEGTLCYAVPDPVTDATVACLLALCGEAGVQILPAVSQAVVTRTAALQAGLPPDGSVCSIPAADFARHRLEPSIPLLITELNSRLAAGDIKLRLLDIYPPEQQVLFDGTRITLDALDRQPEYSHLSTVYLPQSPMTERARYTFNDLLDVMRRLRRPGDGCPWDQEQTHETLRQYVIEEAYELVEAIDQGDMDRVADELGDVMLQVVFHAQVAAEHGTFDITDVTTAICHKMITRHAHIFGDIVCETSEDVLKSWEKIKRKEKGLRATTDAMRDVPRHFPALMRASKVQNKAHQVGFDWKDATGALVKVPEEAAEVRGELERGTDPAGELGDLLFAVVNVARLAGVQPELALGAATDKFIGRFERMEKAIRAEHKAMQDMTLAEMDVYWDAAKRAEKEAP